MSERRRSLGELLAETLSVYRANLRVFVLLAGGVVFVVEVILGLGLGELAASYRSRSAGAVSAITLAASTLVTTPLITAMLARVVLDVRNGRTPSAASAATAGLDAFAPLLVAVIMYIVAVVAGALAFLIPGVYIAVSCYFVAQAVVIDGRRGAAALARSAELVRGGWLHAMVAGLTFNLLVAIPGSLVAIAFDALARSANAEAVVVVGDIVFETLALPLVAIGATLYYLDLRDRLTGDRAV